MTLDQQAIVIVGGSSGIGLATAHAAAAAGGQITIVGRDRAKLDAAAGGLGGGTAVEALDATDRAALDGFFARCSPIDHLVLAASGGRGAGPFRDLATSDLADGFAAKFWPHFHAAQAVLPALRDEGSITFVTAASARVANPGTAGLAAINGALNSLVVTLARELAPRRVNAVSPGVIDTPWWDDKPRAMFEGAAAAAPLGRAGRPEEVAQAIVFLMANRFTTGVVLDVDGGLHLT